MLTNLDDDALSDDDQAARLRVLAKASQLGLDLPEHYYGPEDDDDYDQDDNVKDNGSGSNEYEPYDEGDNDYDQDFDDDDDEANLYEELECDAAAASKQANDCEESFNGKSAKAKNILGMKESNDHTERKECLASLMIVSY